MLRRTFGPPHSARVKACKSLGQPRISDVMLGFQRITMTNHTILCVADNISSAQSLAARLQQAGYAAHSAASASQATALLFVNRSVEAVVLDQRTKPDTGLTVARLLRSFRRDIPILLLSADVVDPLPSCIDGAVCTTAGIEGLLPMLDLVLDAPPTAA